MKTKITRHTLVVHGSGPQEFEAAINAAYEKAGSDLLDVHFNDSIGLCAYITYETTEKIPETLADEAALRGLRFRCYDCPYLERPEDGRKKWCDCKYAPEGYTHKNAHACEFFYKQLAQGRIHVNDIEEREE